MFFLSFSVQMLYRTAIKMIRKFCNTDKSSVQNICIETAPASMKDSEEKRKILLARFCDYYIEMCSDTCFVCEEGGVCIGYVICCPDAVKFRKEFPKFTDRSGKLNLSQKFQCLGDVFLYLPFKTKYPAHLHIDILPEFRRKGIGRRLINALTEELKNQGKCGVMLAVSSDNKNAQMFYGALGFKKIFRMSGTYILGKSI